MKKGYHLNKFGGLELKNKPLVEVETRGLIVNIDQGTFFLGLTADEMVMVCCKLQEALIRRATHDGFMRRSTYDKP